MSAVATSGGPSARDWAAMSWHQKQRALRTARDHQRTHASGQITPGPATRQHLRVMVRAIDDMLREDSRRERLLSRAERFQVLQDRESGLWHALGMTAEGHLLAMVNPEPCTSWREAMDHVLAYTSRRRTKARRW